MKMRFALLVTFWWLNGLAYAMPNEFPPHESPEDLQGTWRLCGEGGHAPNPWSYHVVLRHKKANEFEIRMKEIYDPTVAPARRPSDRTIIRGPFPAKYRHGILSVVAGDKTIEYTLRTDTMKTRFGEERVLVFPAFVRRDDKTWIFKNVYTFWHDLRQVPDWRDRVQSASIKCDSNPFDVPSGKAVFVRKHPNIKEKTTACSYEFKNYPKTGSALDLGVPIENGGSRIVHAIFWYSPSTYRLSPDGGYERRYRRLRPKRGGGMYGGSQPYSKSQTLP